MKLFAIFENLIPATAPPPKAYPPSGLLRFYAYFLGQIGWTLAGLFVAGFVVAVLDTTIPAFIGRLVSMITQKTPAEVAGAWPELLAMAGVVLIVRPLAVLAQNLITNQALAPGLGNMIRWQTHWHLVRQSWAFFQNQSAGVLANRVVQTGPCLRETVVLGINAVWYILIYGGGAIVLLASSDARLTMPVIAWFCCYALLIRYFIPPIRVCSRNVSEVRSNLTGRVVDLYNNMLTIKLFGRLDHEDRVVREAIDAHTGRYHSHLRLNSQFGISLALLNAVMIVGSGALAVYLWSRGEIGIGTVAMTMPLTWQIANIAGGVAQNAAALFENMGQVEDGMRVLAGPRLSSEDLDTAQLRVRGGGVVFENVTFDYGAENILRGINLAIAPGERIGLTGSSGAGKSTLVHLLLRLHEVKGGRILIDGQDIAAVSLDSLRRQISIVTQEPALLNRSLRENILLGRPDATDGEIREAAERASALDFIEAVTDSEGRKGLDAHVGEKGAQLSGGQKQRIVIARALLKNAPILILDEATSALDLETEAAVQGHLDELMRGRTVIAISHRPATIMKLDRLLRLERGQLFDRSRDGPVASAA